MHNVEITLSKTEKVRGIIKRYARWLTAKIKEKSSQIRIQRRQQDPVKIKNRVTDEYRDRYIHRTVCLAKRDFSEDYPSNPVENKQK